MAQFWFKNGTQQIVVNATGLPILQEGQCACECVGTCQCPGPVSALMVANIRGVRSFNDPLSCSGCWDFNSTMDFKGGCFTWSAPMSFCSINTPFNLDLNFGTNFDPALPQGWYLDALITEGTTVNGYFTGPYAACCAGELAYGILQTVGCDWRNAVIDLSCCVIPNSLCLRFTDGLTASDITLTKDLVNGWWRGVGTYQDPGCPGIHNITVFLYYISSSPGVDDLYIGVYWDSIASAPTLPDQNIGPLTGQVAALTTTTYAGYCCGVTGFQVNVRQDPTYSFVCASPTRFTMRIVSDCAAMPEDCVSPSSDANFTALPSICTCPDGTAIPDTLTVTFTAKTGTATCLPDSTTISRIDNGYGGCTWATTTDLCGTGAPFTYLALQGNDCRSWQLGAGGGSFPCCFGTSPYVATDPDICSCNPLSITWTNVDFNPACAAGGIGTGTVTITITP